MTIPQVNFAAKLIAEFGALDPAELDNAKDFIGVPDEDTPTKAAGKMIDQWLQAVKQAKAEAMALVPPVGVGEGTVTGTVASIKEKNGSYGPYLGVVVETAVGNKVWFIAPKGFDAAVGETVAVTGTWKAAEDDAHFAFGKKVTMAAPALV